MRKLLRFYIMILCIMASACVSSEQQQNTKLNINNGSDSIVMPLKSTYDLKVTISPDSPGYSDDSFSKIISVAIISGNKDDDDKPIIAVSPGSKQFSKHNKSNTFTIKSNASSADVQIKVSVNGEQTSQILTVHVSDMTIAINGDEPNLKQPIYVQTGNEGQISIPVSIFQKNQSSNAKYVMSVETAGAQARDISIVTKSIDSWETILADGGTYFFTTIHVNYSGWMKFPDISLKISIENQTTKPYKTLTVTSKRIIPIFPVSESTQNVEYAHVILNNGQKVFLSAYNRTPTIAIPLQLFINPSSEDSFYLTKYHVDVSVDRDVASLELADNNYDIQDRATHYISFKPLKPNSSIPITVHVVGEELEFTEHFQVTILDTNQPRLIINDTSLLVSDPLIIDQPSGVLSMYIAGDLNTTTSLPISLDKGYPTISASSIEAQPYTVQYSPYDISLSQNSVSAKRTITIGNKTSNSFQQFVYFVRNPIAFVERPDPTNDTVISIPDNNIIDTIASQQESLTLSYIYGSVQKSIITNLAEIITIDQQKIKFNYYNLDNTKVTEYIDIDITQKPLQSFSTNNLAFKVKQFEGKDDKPSCLRLELPANNKQIIRELLCNRPFVEREAFNIDFTNKANIINDEENGKYNILLVNTDKTDLTISLKPAPKSDMNATFLLPLKHDFHDGLLPSRPNEPVQDCPGYISSQKTVFLSKTNNSCTFPITAPNHRTQQQLYDLVFPGNISRSKPRITKLTFNDKLGFTFNINVYSCLEEISILPDGGNIQKIGVDPVQQTVFPSKNFFLYLMKPYNKISYYSNYCMSEFPDNYNVTVSLNVNADIKTDQPPSSYYLWWLNNNKTVFDQSDYHSTYFYEYKPEIQAKTLRSAVKNCENENNHKCPNIMNSDEIFLANEYNNKFLFAGNRDSSINTIVSLNIQMNKQNFIVSKIESSDMQSIPNP